MRNAVSPWLAGLLLLSVALPACGDGGAPVVEHLSSGKVLPAGLPFSEAVRVGDLLLLSGMIGVVPGTLELVAGGMAAEARQTMDNIRSVLEVHGSSMDDVVKCTVMLADIAEWPAFNEVYRTYFVERFPARSAFGANGLALGARVEVECMAAGTVAMGDEPSAAKPPPEGGVSGSH